MSTPMGASCSFRVTMAFSNCGAFLVTVVVLMP
jgi:hypothetical protein